MYICTPKIMKAAEAKAVEKGSSYIRLMENAGIACASEMLQRCACRKTLILCGKGNNGGDGFVIAAVLADNGSDVNVLMTGGMPSGIALEEYEKLSAYENITVTSDPSVIDEEYDCICDAVFGTGFHGELSDSMAELFEKVNAKSAFRTAVDIPSGADSISGRVSQGTFRADLTVTFGTIKAGMTVLPARELCGEIITAQIGITEDCFDEINAPVKIDAAYAAKALPERNELSHKGSFGKLMVIGGCSSMSGAAAMNVKGALRSGAGLVRLASTRPVIDRAAAGIYECTYTELSANADGTISRENIPHIISLIDTMDVIAIGSGLGCSDDTAELTEEIIKNSGEKPVIIDADGLNCIAHSIDIISNAECRAVLTPHPKELSRLLGVSLDEVMADRLSAACELSRRTGAVVAAKGYPTYIVSPDGRAAASYTGNGGLSRGGSGDVLTGIISGVVCSNKGKRLFESVCLGVYVFGLAADIAVSELSMTGMLPTDAADRLPSAFKIIEKQKEQKQ